ncbi:amino acid ABC transporter permease [uncultured Mailhella sp.]|uniref:amino acid ABC transporter permease n=1 Tax=uncultured Mailhella sp. TaxID=1981031 RepID=UPI0026221417|nr:amino acid ABC transporter permease [uncultured Mailhella sp.]
MREDNEKELPAAPEGRIVVPAGGLRLPASPRPPVINAWSLSLVGAVAVLVFLCAVWPDPYLDILAFVPGGLLITFEVTILSICCAVPLGLLTGLGRLSRSRVINLIASTYVEVIRGIPLLVQIFYIYYALAMFLQVSSLTSAVVAISFCYGAYMGEVFRAGIMAVPKGQNEASRSLGFNRFQTMIHVILPQALRTILPPVGNECIAMLKDTSLVSVMAMPDLMQHGRSFAAKTYLYFETYTVIALIYLIITLLLSKAVNLMESRLDYYEKRK